MRSPKEEELFNCVFARGLANAPTLSALLSRSGAIYIPSLAPSNVRAEKLRAKWLLHSSEAPLLTQPAAISICLFWCHRRSKTRARFPSLASAIFLIYPAGATLYFPISGRFSAAFWKPASERAAGRLVCSARGQFKANPKDDALLKHTVRRFRFSTTQLTAAAFPLLLLLLLLMSTLAEAATVDDEDDDADDDRRSRSRSAEGKSSG